MDLNSLYGMVDPELAAACAPDTIPLAGQLFIRQVGTEGLCLAVGILVIPPQLATEHIYPAKVNLYYKSGEDRTQDARGLSADGVLKSAWWRVRPRPRSA